MLECKLFYWKVEDGNSSGNDYKNVLSMGEQWEWKNPFSRMTVENGDEAWENSWIINYLATTFMKENLEHSPNDFSYFLIWF
jgi:hypothetical protein